MKKATKYEAGQEYEATPETEESFVKFLGKGGSQMMLEAEKSFASSSKGKPGALTKGGGKSGGKGKLAIKDGKVNEEEEEKGGEKSEAAQMAEAIRKAQRCKEQLVVGISDMGMQSLQPPRVEG